eukprot:scaffold299532_cov10-Tisochrysis_lutea.AAC.1
MMRLAQLNWSFGRDSPTPSQREASWWESNSSTLVFSTGDIAVWKHPDYVSCPPKRLHRTG